MTRTDSRLDWKWVGTLLTFTVFSMVVALPWIALTGMAGQIFGIYGTVLQVGCLAVTGALYGICVMQKVRADQPTGFGYVVLLPAIYVAVRSGLEMQQRSIGDGITYAYIMAVSIAICGSLFVIPLAFAHLALLRYVGRLLIDYGLRMSTRTMRQCALAMLALLATTGIEVHRYVGGIWESERKAFIWNVRLPQSLESRIVAVSNTTSYSTWWLSLAPDDPDWERFKKGSMPVTDPLSFPFESYFEEAYSTDFEVWNGKQYLPDPTGQEAYDRLVLIQELRQDGRIYAAIQIH